MLPRTRLPAACWLGILLVSSALQAQGTEPGSTFVYGECRRPVVFCSLMATQMSEIRASALLYPSLVTRTSPKGDQFKCWLATRVRWGAKGVLEWIFTLRDDVEWVDAKGMPTGRLCVEDVVSTVRLINSPRTRPKPTFARQIERAEPGPGEHEVTIFLRYAREVGNPYSAFLFPVLPSASRLEYITRDTQELRSPKYFLGPYVLTPSRSAHRIVFMANQRYFDGAPKIRRIVMRVNDDMAVLADLLRTGVVHALPDLPPSVRGDLAWGGYSLTFADAAPYSFDFLGFNLDAKTCMAGKCLPNPFSKANRALRRAVAASLDLQRISRRVYQDYAQRLQTPLHFHSLAGLPAALTAEEPDAEAQEALRGFIDADGQPPGIVLAYRRGPSDEWYHRVCRELQKELAGLLRVSVDLLALDERQWQHELYQKPRDERGFHIALDRFSMGPELDISPLLESTGRLNFMRYNNGYVDHMLALARRGDRKSWADAYGRVHHAICQDPPVVVCWHVKGYMGYNHELFDCKLDPFLFFSRVHAWRYKGP